MRAYANRARDQSAAGGIKLSLPDPGEFPLPPPPSGESGIYPAGTGGNRATSRDGSIARGSRNSCLSKSLAALGLERDRPTARTSPA